MTEPIGAPDRERLAAASVLVRGLVTGARTVLLYKDGHPMKPQIAERVAALVPAAIGQDTNLTLDIKAKQVLLGEAPVPDTKETTAFAAALHQLGVGQVLITDRLTPEGLLEFFKVLNAKPEGTTTLSDVQKAVQQVRIDGLQMSFILSFVVTGEEEAEQTPGQLSEEQVQAFIAARNLPDFLYLLFKQNEPLHGKQADSVSELLEGVLFREVAVERLEAELPWSLYDPRIRVRWDELARERQGGRREALISRLSLSAEAEVRALDYRLAHEHDAAMTHSLESVHAFMQAPPAPPMVKFASLAYVRLLGELAARGDLPALLKESGTWDALAGGPMAPAFEDLLSRARETTLTPALASGLVRRLGEGDQELPTLEAFSLRLGDGLVPLLLEELRNVSDKNHRQRLLRLLASLGRALGTQRLVLALDDEDWLLVASVIQVLGDVDGPAHAKSVQPLLKHKHRKVREAAVVFLSKTGGPEAADGLAACICATREPEEVRHAITRLSMLAAPGVDRRLVEAFPRLSDYSCQVALVTALGRVATASSIPFLTGLARRNWYEVLTGRNKELRHAARRALEDLRKGGL